MRVRRSLWRIIIRSLVKEKCWYRRVLQMLFASFSTVCGLPLITTQNEKDERLRPNYLLWSLLSRSFMLWCKDQRILQYQSIEEHPRDHGRYHSVLINGNEVVTEYGEEEKLNVKHFAAVTILSNYLHSFAHTMGATMALSTSAQLWMNTSSQATMITTLHIQWKRLLYKANQLLWWWTTDSSGFLSPFPRAVAWKKTDLPPSYHT